MESHKYSVPNQRGMTLDGMDQAAVWNVLRELYHLDIANMTPVQALVLLNELQTKAGRSSPGGRRTRALTVTIQVLPPELQRLIAAGEVVERPASVVKELIENAIDAGAHTLSIDIRDGGLASIRVSDDGTGMSRVDAPLSLKRFSTSKIASLEDLEAIRTLGFRGEALSSIAAVAQVEILTRTDQRARGHTRLCGQRGQTTSEGEIDVEPAASPVGASVTVRGLYAQLPARRRFLKSRLRETELIQARHCRLCPVLPTDRVPPRRSMAESDWSRRQAPSWRGLAPCWGTTSRARWCPSSGARWI